MLTHLYLFILGILWWLFGRQRPDPREAVRTVVWGYAIPKLVGNDRAGWFWSPNFTSEEAERIAKGEIMDIIELRPGLDDGLINAVFGNFENTPTKIQPDTLKAVSGDASVVADGVLVGAADPDATAFQFR